MKKEELESKISEMEKGLKVLKKELKNLVVVPTISLKDYFWDDIIDMAKNDKAEFKIGDEREIELITGEKVHAKVIGLNHDDLSSGNGKAKVTFLIEDLEGEYRWNEDSSNKGGWRDCLLRNKTMQILLNSMPENIRNAIVEVNKRTTIGEKSTEITITKDKMFVLSVSEHGMSKESAKGYASADEGEQYEYFKKNDIDKKRWWTAFRSPCLPSRANFCSWSNFGYVYNYTASSTNRVALCFCI